MNIIEYIISAGTLALLLFGVFYFGRKIYDAIRIRKELSPKQLEHRRKEEELLKSLLMDIRENTDTWFSVKEVEGPKNCIINDKKNIGITYNGDLLAANIYLNLKTLVEFDPQHPDTVVVHVAGPHVYAFLQKAEAYIDKRGNELEFFKDKLNRQL